MSKDFYISDFYCIKTGLRAISLPRKISKQNEPGHMKKIWCPICNEEHNCCEVRPFGKYTEEDFKIEYEMDNFDESGNRKESYGRCVARYYQEGWDLNDVQ